MKKKLTAAVIVLAVCLALLLAFAIYITMSDPAAVPQITDPDTQSTTGATQAPVEEADPSQEERPEQETDPAAATEENDNSTEPATEPDETIDRNTAPADPEETVTVTTAPQEDPFSPTESMGTEPMNTEPDTEQTEPTGDGAAEGLQGDNELPFEPFE